MSSKPYSRVPHARDWIVAGLLLGVAAMLASQRPERIRPEFAERAFGVLMGMVVMLYANRAPKALPRRLTTARGATCEQDFRRFAGWTLVLAGLLYSLTWWLAPIELANTVSGVLLGAAVLLVLGRLVWIARGGARA